MSRVATVRRETSESRVSVDVDVDGSGSADVHVRVLAGRTAHHVAEARFEAVARALPDAVAVDGRVAGVPSITGAW